MGFSVDSHPDIPNVVRHYTRHNITKADDEILEQVLEALIGADRGNVGGPSRKKRW